jgi:hypothetical protein
MQWAVIMFRVSNRWGVMPRPDIDIDWFTGMNVLSPACFPDFNYASVRRLVRQHCDSRDHMHVDYFSISIYL